MVRVIALFSLGWLAMGPFAGACEDPFGSSDRDPLTDPMADGPGFPDLAAPRQLLAEVLNDVAKSFRANIEQRFEGIVLTGDLVLIPEGVDPFVFGQAQASRNAMPLLGAVALLESAGNETLSEAEASLVDRSLRELRALSPVHPNTERSRAFQEGYYSVLYDLRGVIARATIGLNGKLRDDVDLIPVEGFVHGAVSSSQYAKPLYLLKQGEEVYFFAPEESRSEPMRRFGPLHSLSESIANRLQLPTGETIHAGRMTHRTFARRVDRMIEKAEKEKNFAEIEAYIARHGFTFPSEAPWAKDVWAPAFLLDLAIVREHWDVVRYLLAHPQIDLTARQTEPLVSNDRQGWLILHSQQAPRDLIEEILQRQLDALPNEERTKELYSVYVRSIPPTQEILAELFELPQDLLAYAIDETRVEVVRSLWKRMENQNVELYGHSPAEQAYQVYAIRAEADHRDFTRQETEILNILGGESFRSWDRWWRRLRSR